MLRGRPFTAAVALGLMGGAIVTLGAQANRRSPITPQRDVEQLQTAMRKKHSQQ